MFYDTIKSKQKEKAGEKMALETHTFQPVFDAYSKVLILGTFPSVKSRENCFYYGHPQNRFWKVIAHLTGEPVPETIEQKKSLLLQNKIAIWDVIQSCDIVGSSDSSIKNVTASDLSLVLTKSSISKIFANGATAAKLYNKYQKESTGMEITKSLLYSKEKRLKNVSSFPIG